MQSESSVTATDTFQAKIKHELPKQNIQATFVAPHSVKLQGETYADITSGAIMIIGKFEKFREYVEKLSRSWEFNIQTIWNASTCEVDLEAVVHAAAKSIPNIRCEYEDGSTCVDMYLQGGGGTLDVPAALMVSYLEAIQRKVQSKTDSILLRQPSADDGDSSDS
ncbi:hypothetical protein HDU87_004706 [Geranomyces variabilis]|uniref:Uncharacterized protein n=1 Tax=Geranomyces variabilis TaxID=109894 RepID=A0AAD5THY0_9FUNG|nr:hypothetical protein HDU87_004706 [Geranomyces variabilis]